MDFVVSQRRRQLLGIEIIGTIALRFILVATASVILIKLVSIILARSTELHALELISAANSHLANSDLYNGSSSGGKH